MRIKVGDFVEVIAGEDRGVQAKVLSVDSAANKVIVEGVNRVFKHMRRSQKNPQGGRLSKEMPISASNVLLVCPSTGRGARLGVRILPDGSKERHFRNKTGESAGQVAPAKASRAKKKN